MEELASKTCTEHPNERANELHLSARTEEIEVRVRHERHRRWRPEERLRIVQETLRPNAVLADVARRYGIGTGLLYTWRRAMLATAVEGFIPVQVSPETEAPPPRASRAVAMPRGSAMPRLMPPAGRIEVEFPNGVRVRVDCGVDEAALRNVLAALEGR